MGIINVMERLVMRFMMAFTLFEMIDAKASIVPCEQVLTYLIGRQSGERVRGVVERKSEGFRQGDAISRGVEGMYHGEILSSFLLWGKGTNKMASIEMKVYISYMMYLMTVFVQWIEEKCIFVNVTMYMNFHRVINLSHKFHIFCDETT